MQASKNISVITTTVSPGVYCNGITISGGANVTFSAGTYILNGGGLNVSGNSTITGNGVFFYNTSSGYPFAPITISGGLSVKVLDGGDVVACEPNDTACGGYGGLSPNH